MAELVPMAERAAKLEAIIDSRMPSLAELVPDQKSVVRMKRAFMTAVRKNPALLDCKPASLMGALVEATQLGLMPGVSQQCAIVPFGKEATLIPMYQGMLDLVYRGGHVSWVKCDVVYEKDKYEYAEEADRTVFYHSPTPDEEPGEMIAVYLKVKVRGDDTPALFWMWKRDVLEHRNRSRAWHADKESSPWGTDPAAMWKKTIVRVAAKFLPKSEDGSLSRAIALDEQADRGEPQRFDYDGGGEPIDVTPEGEGVEG